MKGMANLRQCYCWVGIDDGIFVLKLEWKFWHFWMVQWTNPEELAITTMDGKEANHCTCGHMEKDGQKIWPKWAQKWFPTTFIDQKGLDQIFGIELANSNFRTKSHCGNWVNGSGKLMNFGEDLPSKNANKSERQTNPKRRVIWMEMSWSRWTQTPINWININSIELVNFWCGE